MKATQKKNFSVTKDKKETVTQNSMKKDNWADNFVTRTAENSNALMKYL